MIQSSRPFKPELFYEMQKCLPLPKAVNILVNVPSREIVLYNAPKILCNLRRLKTSLEEYIQTNALPVLNEGQDDVEEGNNRVVINNDLEWKPEFNALLRYGSWMTSIRPFEMDSGKFIVGIPKNFVGELLLHLANSGSTKLMLPSVQMNFRRAPLPTFLEQFFNEKEYQIGDRIFFEPIALKADDGRIVHIFDGELPGMECGHGYYSNLFVMNKMDKSWFKITMMVDHSMKFIRQLEFSRWNMQTMDDVVEFITNNEFELLKQGQGIFGNKLGAGQDIYCDDHLDMFLRRGAGFTQFRHFEVKKPHCLYTEDYDNYADFLVDYVSKTKYPEDFLESIDINLAYEHTPSIFKFFELCAEDEGTPAGGYFVTFEDNDEEKLHILSVTTDFRHNLEFTLANGPTNGAYVFNFDVKFEYALRQIAIKIRKRKVVTIDLGKKRKTSSDDGEEDEDGPTCSNKIMKT